MPDGGSHFISEAGDANARPSRRIIPAVHRFFAPALDSGELVAQARTQDIYRFVSRSLAAVPAGSESDHMDMDQLIDLLSQTEPS